MAEQNISMNFQYGMQSLNYYSKNGKITSQEYSIIQQAMKNLFTVINDSVKNYNSLHNTSKQLKKQVNAAKFQLESATNKQSQASQATQKLARLLKTAQVAYESQKTAYDNLVFEQDELQKQIQRRQQEIKNEARKAQQDMQPTRQRYEKQIKDTKAQIQKTNSQAVSCQNMLKSNVLTISEIKQKIQQADAQQKRLLQQKLKIVDSPQHYLKSAQNLQIQIMGMQAELKVMQDQAQRKNKICNQNDQKRKQQVQYFEQLQKERFQDLQRCRALQTQIDRLKNQNMRINNHKDQQKLQSAEIQIQQDAKIRNRKDLQQNISKYVALTTLLQKNQKKLAAQKKQHSDDILQYQIMLTKVKKQKAKLKSQNQDEISKTKDIQQQISEISNKKGDIEGRAKEADAYRKNIEEQIKKRQNTLTDLKKSVQITQKQVDKLTQMRQTMARKASSAMSQVRKTKAELRVKQLDLLDLTKKYKQTQSKLQHYKALFEQVKSARNKFLKLIQNSSQDLAELKQRIKILQNQLQILKNQSTEKDKTLQGFSQMSHLEKHKRDQMKSKLNKLQFQKKQKLQFVDQNINQIQKLNMIVLTLNKDIQRLKSNFGDVLENRNYTGIQLIDRNDQLCILYEKQNTQQKVLRKGDVAIKSLEDEIRMITIQIKQTQRKIKVSRDKIIVIPALAEEVLKIQKELDSVKQREAQLSKQLQNPNNQGRWRQLPGQDLDQEALDAKISVLENRLNFKKQQLLQKQLVLDEVTNLVDKLKKQAQEGRQSTLQVSQKINQFQSRLKDLTRRMKAVISQLAVCQANAIRFSSQRQKLAKLVESSKERMQKGYPPTPQTQIQYLKMIRDNNRYQQQRQIRMQRQMIQQSYPPFATKTTAEHRVNAYIPDEIGLPKPYGIHAPYKPSQLGSNMRHFKKPKVRQIQI